MPYARADDGGAGGSAPVPAWAVAAGLLSLPGLLPVCAHAPSALFLARPQTQPRPSKRRKSDEEQEEEAGEEFVPAAMTRRILREARTQQEEVDADESPAGAWPCCHAAASVAEHRGFRGCLVHPACSRLQYWRHRIPASH